VTVNYSDRTIVLINRCRGKLVAAPKLYTFVKLADAMIFLEEVRKNGYDGLVYTPQVTTTTVKEHVRITA